MFIGHYSSITMFYHTHTVDGVTYCHSHFYSADSQNDPVKLPHSKQQLKLIQEINHTTWNNTIDFPELETPVYALVSEFLIANTAHTFYVTVPFCQLRAPPSLLV